MTVQPRSSVQPMSPEAFRAAIQIQVDRWLAALAEGMR